VTPSDLFVREFKSEPNKLFINETQIKHLENFISVNLPLAHNSGNWGIKAQKTYQTETVHLKAK